MTDFVSDYQRMAEAIDFIRAHAADQPSLAEVAARVKLSEFHFQRLFSRWAGVTPKRYLQALTLEQAKKRLSESSQSMLDTSFELGLSSGSRLYDHFVRIEAVTPAEYRMAGAGLTITCGYHDTPYGQMFVALTDRGICQLDFVDSGEDDVPLQRLQQTWNRADVVVDPAVAGPVIDRLFSGRGRSDLPLSLWVRGTNFQLNVWKALLRIQSGEVASYRDIAAAIGQPRASRAVGTAIGANPVALVIPCHRVIRQSGDLGGYRWGEVRKHAMLVRELAPSG